MECEFALRKEDWTVREITQALAIELVSEFHYSKGCSNTAAYRHGLFRTDSEECLGVALWIPPTKSAAQATYPANWEGVLALSRLVVHPDVPKNGASFLMGWSMRVIDRKRWPCLLTYADEWQGHTGAIYRATNWTYVGQTKPQPLYKIGERMVARKAGPKTRTHNEMIQLGAELVERFKKHKFVHIV